MQNILYCEYVFGRPWKKHDYLQRVYQHIIRAIDFMKITPEIGGHKIELDILGIEGAGMDPEEVKEFAQDMAGQNLLVAAHYYRKNPSNYVFSKYLTGLLNETSGDVECKYLQKKASGYIEMQGLFDKDGDRVLGAFFRINDDPCWCLHVVWLLESKNGVIDSFFYNDIEQGTILDMVKKSTNTETKRIDDLVLTTVRNSSHWEKNSMELTTIQAILWILHKKDLVPIIDEFAQKKSKREGQEKIYTKLPYHICDLERKFKVTDSFTRGHPKWIPHGPRGKQHLEFHYIQPYPRNLKKYE